MKRALLGLALAAFACEPKRGVSAGQPSSPQAAAPRGEGGLELQLVRRFSKVPSVYQLKSGLVICDDCAVDRDDRADERAVYVFDARGFRPMPWTLNDRHFSNLLGRSVSFSLRQTGGGAYEFRDDVDAPMVDIRGVLDDDGIARNGALGVSHRFKRVANGWKATHDYGVDPGVSIELQEAPSALPRAYDEIFARAPFLGDPGSFTTRIAGAGGPVMLIGPRRVDVFDGKQWNAVVLSVEVGSAARRLSDGSTLLWSKLGLFLLDRSGSPSLVLLPEGDRTADARWYLAGDRPVFLVGQALYAPADTKLTVVAPREREPFPERPPKPTPNAQGRLEPAFPPLAGFTPACATPFVVLLAAENDYGFYDTTAAALVGHTELQDKLFFFDFRRDDKTYFGAQATDEASARALMAIHKAGQPTDEPVLGCLDARGYVPDPYTPRWDARQILINLYVGRVL